MSTLNWKNIFMDEDEPEKPTVDLPDDNEEKGEDNGQGSEAAGALSEDGNSEGISNEPEGEDEITGTKSTEYDDIFSFMNEDKEGEGKKEGEEEEEGGDGEDGDDEGSDDDGAGDNKPAEGCSGKKKSKKGKKKARKNIFSLFNEEGDDDKGEDDPDGEGEGDEDEEDGDEDDKPAEGCGGRKKSKKGGKKKTRKNVFSLFDEDAPEAPTEDLPDDNEENGEDNGQGSEAAGALSEDDDPDGMKTEPAGEDEITGTKSTEYDDVFSFLNEDKNDEQPEDNDEESGDEDGEGEGGEGEESESKNKKKGKKKKARRNFWQDADDEGDDKGKGEDDGDSEGDDDGEGEGKGDDDAEDDEEEEKKDFFRFFDEGIEEPENLPGDPEPADPVDQNGKGICPIGNPDLPENLTEPVLEPVASENGETKELQNRRRISDRFFFN